MDSINIREIAKIVGVSRSTVSRALNDGYVSKEIREQIYEVVNKLGYNRNMLAQKFRTNKSNFIGLIIPDISNEFFAKLAREIELFFMKNNYGLFLCNSEGNADIEDFYIKTLLENRVEAVIITPCTKAVNDRLAKSGIPFVFADREIPGLRSKQLAVVTSDNRHGGEIAARELALRGAKRVLVVSDRHGTSSALLERLKGFKTTADDLGVEYIHHKIRFSIKEAEIQTNEMLKKEEFDAVFCTQDLIAVGVMKALSGAGIPIPDDIQVLGFDGLDIGDYLCRPLSTIKQDISRIGIVAAEAMLTLIRGEEFPPRTVVPVEFIQRDTTKAMAPTAT
jgi:DNA-binding LacI/PurR family transcriptional regulator